MKLVRHPQSPLLYPNPLHQWESVNVFNCAVTEWNGLFHMHYRAQGVDFISHIGYAVSADGLHWNRLEKPVVAPHQGREDYRGVEDPRVTPLEGTFYMCYTAYGENGNFPMIAQSDNLITWTDVGPLEKTENKDHVLFPEKINGRYAILHRRRPHIWIAYSDDLKTWTDHTIIMSPREDNLWDAKSIGANGVPVKTEHGWLLFYHGYGKEHIYRQSVALLDLQNPAKVIHRPKSFFMQPEETWEIRGDVPNVIFSCSNNVVNNQLYFYYAGADRLIGLATAPMKDVIQFARKGK
ncbi:MAG: glycosidase [Chloroflexota bacterium]|nr:glycosidase [Chloroflexota bacterium]NOG63980.1 glycosidase [Chloroflexota bacterium]GIK65716.1 MAG: glycosidase [Chloroflexota bacterium]